MGGAYPYMDLNAKYGSENDQTYTGMYRFVITKVIKFTSCLPMVGGSLRLPPPLKTGRHDIGFYS